MAGTIIPHKVIKFGAILYKIIYGNMKEVDYTNLG